MSLTKSAQAERERILAIHKQASIEVVQAMLASGLPGGSKRNRDKSRWVVRGFELATDALKRAIEETAPSQ